MRKKHVCKILCALIVAVFLSFGASTVFVYAGHHCVECATVYVICSCPAKITRYNFAEATGLFVLFSTYIASASVFLCLFLRSACPVDLKTRMNN